MKSSSFFKSSKFIQQYSKTWIWKIWYKIGVKNLSFTDINNNLITLISGDYLLYITLNSKNQKQVERFRLLYFLLYLSELGTDWFNTALLQFEKLLCQFEIIVEIV